MIRDVVVAPTATPRLRPSLQRHEACWKFSPLTLVVLTMTFMPLGSREVASGSLGVVTGRREVDIDRLPADQPLALRFARP